MAISNFIPEIWAKRIAATLQESLVGLNCVNQNYIGEITRAGQTLNIPALDSVETEAYTGADFTWDTLSDTVKQLIIDQADTFHFKLLDTEDRQSINKQLQAIAGESGMRGLLEDADTWIFEELATSADSTTQIDDGAGAAFVLTSTNIYDTIVSAKMALSKNSVPKVGRYLVLSPEEIALVEKSDEFVKASAVGDDTLRSGFTGRYLGFNVYESPNLYEAADVRYIPFGHPVAYTYGSQIMSVEATRIEKNFATGVKGLHTYGGVAILPKGIGYIMADIS